MNGAVAFARYPLDKFDEARQSNNMKPKIVTSTLMILAFFAGMSSSLFLIPFWIIPFQAAVEKSTNPADWIGFAGNFAAGIMTLVAAVIAWVAVQRQIQAQDVAIHEAETRRQAERAEMHAGARNNAIVALKEPIEGAASLLYCIKRARAAEKPDDMREWDSIVEQASSMLRRALQYFSLSAMASDMAWEDRRKYLAALTRLSTFEIFVSHRPTTIPRTDFLDYVIKECVTVQACITEFDVQLGGTFEKQSNVEQMGT